MGKWPVLTPVNTHKTVKIQSSGATSREGLRVEA